MHFPPQKSFLSLLVHTYVKPEKIFFLRKNIATIVRYYSLKHFCKEDTNS